MRPFTSFFVILMAMCSWGWSQTALLQGFDFQSGQYQMLVLPVGYGAPTDGSEIKYVTDPAVLGRLQQDFVYDQEPPLFRSRCEDDLQLLFCRNGRVEETIGIDIRCRAISSSKGNFLYDGALQLHGSLPARKQVDRFKSLAQARHAMDSIANLPGLIYLQSPAWEFLEGQFDFYQNDDFRREEQIKADLRAEIAKAYPGQPFSLEVNSAGGSSDKGWSYHVRVTSNAELFQMFRLYPPTYGGWQAFSLELVSYWR